MTKKLLKYISNFQKYIKIDGRYISYLFDGNNYGGSDKEEENVDVTNVYYKVYETQELGSAAIIYKIENGQYTELYFFYPTNDIYYTSSSQYTTIPEINNNIVYAYVYGNLVTMDLYNDSIVNYQFFYDNEIPFTLNQNATVNPSDDDINNPSVNEIIHGTQEIAGKTYRTVTIGNQTWLAQNLDLETSGSIVSNRRSENEDYGRLYRWDAAKALTIAGWHLPTREEWNTLMNFVGGTNIAGTKLKATFGWDSGNGTDDYGFGVLPAGDYDGNSYYNMGSYAYFWTSEEYSSYDAYRKFFDTSSRVGEYSGYKPIYYSVRLIKDN